MPMFPAPLPPTPTPSIHSPTRQSSVQDFVGLKRTMSVVEQPIAGPSHGWRSYPHPPRSELPPTPPVHDGDKVDSPLREDGPSINFVEPDLPTRRVNPARRPVSAYPAARDDGQPPVAPYRKYTDPTPRTYRYPQQEPVHQLDVDLDAYSATDFDTEADGEPTLSFVTTSTADSTISTPSVGGTYGYSSEAIEEKPGMEPKIRMRQTAGRTNAYSSAESSMASGAYSYHAYNDQIYHPQPPPMPIMPTAFAQQSDHVGLGITAEFPLGSQRDSPSENARGNPPLSPSHSFTHRPWQRDIITRLRSDSASSSITTASASTSDSGPSSSRIQNHSFQYNFDSLPWETETRTETEPEAIALVDEGRERILDMDRIEAMGGVIALTSDVIRSMSGITHLLLPHAGSQILSFLSTLLSVLAPSLVVLDISHSDLSFLPDELQQCTSLEELNVSGNPLRHIASWVGELVALRVLAVDGCGLQCLPTEVSHLSSLHTLCVRRNKLVSLPSWLCLLGRLETLRVDDNPFSQEWEPIVAPILAGPSRPSTAIMSGPSRSNSNRHLSINNGLRSPPSMASLTSSMTVSSIHSPDLAPSGSSASFMGEQPPVTTPSSAAQSIYQLTTLGSIAEDHPHSAPLRDEEDNVGGSSKAPDEHYFKGLRKMRSAGALLVTKTLNSAQSPLQSPTGVSVSETAHPPPTSTKSPPTVNKFASLGSADGRRAASVMGSYADDAPTSKLAPSTSSAKNGKWGFLRKMSMNRLKSDKGVGMTASATANLKSMPPLQHQNSEPIQTLPSRPSLSGTRSAMTLPTRRMMSSSETTEFGQVTGPKTVPVSATLPIGGLPTSTSLYGNTGGVTSARGKRRSFLPVDLGPPSINISIPSASPFMPPMSDFDGQARLPTAVSEATIANTTMTAPPDFEVMDVAEARYGQGLESIKSYLRDLFDLSRPPIEPYGGFEVVGSTDGSYAASSAPSENLGSPMSSNAARGSFVDVRRARRPTLDTQTSRATSIVDSDASMEGCEPIMTGKKFKNDKAKRAKIVREIYETERTYVRGLGELVSIYVRPASQPINPNKPQSETVIPAAERKIVFGGVESILTIHRDNFLPALEKAVRPLLEGQDDDEGNLSASAAHHVGEVFRTYIAYMKQYSTYINNFDNAMSRMKTWVAPNSNPSTPSFSSKPATPNTGAIGAAAASVGMSAISLPSPDTLSAAASHQMISSQKKRVKKFLQRCREHPLHSQINLESYLLLPIQRVPRYKLLLEDLSMCTPARGDGIRDTLDDALNEISSLASLMNEEKREADSRMRLLNWQQRITKSGPSPLIQPHRRLMLEGPLTLIRLVKKASTFVECESTVISDGEQTITPSKVVVPVDYIKPELVDRQVMLVLCSDLMVLATQRGEGWEGAVDLFNVLRMATLKEPASIVHGNVLRVVDNKSIYYFNGASHDNTVQWCRAINSARRR